MGSRWPKDSCHLVGFQTAWLGSRDGILAALPPHRWPPALPMPVLAKNRDTSSFKIGHSGMDSGPSLRHHRTGPSRNLLESLPRSSRTDGVSYIQSSQNWTNPLSAHARLSPASLVRLSSSRFHWISLNPFSFLYPLWNGSQLIIVSI